VATPAGGSYTGAQSVTLAVDAHATATYYTTDGSTPTTGSTLYTGAITTVGSGTETIKAFSHGTGLYSDSAVMTDTYVITAAGFTFISSVAAETDSANNVTTAGINTTGANFLVVIAGSNGGNSAANAVIDSKGNTWTALTAPMGSFSTPQIFYSFPTTVGTGHTFKLTNTSSSGVALSAMAFSGIVAYEAGTSHTGADQTGGPTTTQPGSTSPASVGDLIVSGIAPYFPNNGSSTVASINSSFIAEAFAVGTDTGSFSAYKAATAGDVSGGSNPTWTVTGGTNRLSATIAVFSA